VWGFLYLKLLLGLPAKWFLGSSPAELMNRLKFETPEPERPGLRNYTLGTTFRFLSILWLIRLRWNYLILAFTSISPCNGFPFRSLLQLTGFQWSYLNSPPPTQHLDNPFKVKVILRPTVSRPVCLGVRHPRPNFLLLSLIIFRQLQIWLCGAPSLTKSRVCTFQLFLGVTSAAVIRSESHGTHEHILLSLFLRLHQPWGPGSCIYFLQEQGSPGIWQEVKLKGGNSKIWRKNCDESCIEWNNNTEVAT
jgi:hypothetical protein